MIFMRIALLLVMIVCVLFALFIVLVLPRIWRESRELDLNQYMEPRNNRAYAIAIFGSVGTVVVGVFLLSLHLFK